MIYRYEGLVMICLLIISAGCTTYSNISSNYDRSIDFNEYETFAWSPDSANADKDKSTDAFDNDIVQNNAKNYITHRLSERGYLINTDSPDVIMELVLLNEKKERIVTYHSPLYSGYYFHNPYYFPYYYPHRRFYTWNSWRGWYYEPWGNHITTYSTTYVHGTITLNMYDRKLKRLVWTASAEGNIYDPAYIHYDVHPAIDEILKYFPVKQLNNKKKNESNLKNKISVVDDRKENVDAMYGQ